VKRFPNLYGDNSAFSVPNGRIRGKHLERCVEESLRGRILHGSDSPVPVLGHEAYFRGYIGRRAFKASLQQTNPLERDYQLKRAMGFPDESFTRAAEILRIPVKH
jgi:hypothetical protein